MGDTGGMEPETPRLPAGFENLVDPFTSYMGLRFTDLSGDRVVGVWEATSKVHQPFGIVHGGAYCAVTETLASMAASVWLGDKGQCVGVNNNTDFFRAVSEGVLVSTGTPLHRGRSQQLWVVETVSEADGKLVARGQVRIQNLYR